MRIILFIFFFIYKNLDWLSISILDLILYYYVIASSNVILSDNISNK